MIFLRFIHLLAITVWIGTMVFFSFVAAPAIFKALPRETAGDVVAKIFPKYYQIGCLCSLLSLGTLVLFSSGNAAWHLPRVICLAVMTLITFYSGFVIGPNVRRLKVALRVAKASPDHEAQSKRFSRLHGISMALNLCVLITGLVFLFLTALDFRLT